LGLWFSNKLRGALLGLSAVEGVLGDGEGELGGFVVEIVLYA